MSRVIYLNHNGAMLAPGASDSRIDTSELVKTTSYIPGWDATPEQWSEMVSFTRSIWSAYDVEVTDVDPGSRPHIEVLIGGSALDIGLSRPVGGFAPVVPCSVIENAIVFAFTENLGGPEYIAEVAAQEVGHAYGLDHEYLRGELMSYSAPHVGKTFRDVDAPCGENEPRACAGGCRPHQNSHKVLLELLGSSAIGHRDQGDDASELAEFPSEDATDLDQAAVGCSAGSPSLAMLLLFAAMRRRSPNARMR